MSERWKPECGETYYFVDSLFCIGGYEWRDDSTDRSYYEIGNCFETKAEAEAAAEKVKALLLSLHYNEISMANDGTLPKLTEEVFNRPDCPEWAKYAAVDECGSVRLFSDAPWLGASCWSWSKGEVSQLFGVKFDASDWQKSRIKRPKKNTLPDWCKVGEWVWSIAFNTYFKVDKVDGLFIYGTDFSGGEYCVTIEHVRQARPRPYNAKEMRGMVGKVLNNPCSSRLVTAYRESDCIKILTSIGWYTADDLMTSDYTIDGKPCGVLEHLNENEEWVE